MGTVGHGKRNSPHVLGVCQSLCPVPGNYKYWTGPNGPVALLSVFVLVSPVSLPTLGHRRVVDSPVAVWSRQESFHNALGLHSYHHSGPVAVWN